MDKESETKRKNIGYVRTSKTQEKSQTTENQLRALRAFDPKMKIYIDENISGNENLRDPESQWSKMVRPEFERDPENTQIVLYSFDRLGRRKGAVLYEVENITEAGGAIYVIRENKTFTDTTEIDQSIELTFRSLADENYRTEVVKKTQRAIDKLKEAGVPLGRKPSLTERHISEIRALRELGLGYTSIGKAVRTLRKSDGAMTATSPKVIKRVLSGEYESREAFEKRQDEARERMKAEALLLSQRGE